MTRLLCAAPRCRIPHRHTDTCPGTCGGCQPAQAADGIRLCGHDLGRLADNATKLGRLHTELEHVLKAAGQTGPSSSKPGPGTPPRDAVVEVRAEIRHVLTSWCRLIADERGLQLPQRWAVQTLPEGFIGPPRRVQRPDDTIPAVARYIAKHAEWLAAQDYAGDAADELATLVGRAWGLAYPSGGRLVHLGPCPQCDGQLTAIVRTVDQQLPSEVVCDGEQAHRWPADRWRELDRLVMAKRRKVAA